MTTCNVVADAATRVIRLEGQFVASAVPEVRSLLLPLVAEGATVTIDCMDVEYVDSMGIGLLIAAYNSLVKQHGTLILTSVSTELRELLHLLRLDQRFQIIDGEEHP